MAALRTALLFGVFVLSCAALRGAEPTTDALGDSLPKGALARLGSVRGWHPEWVEALAFSPDGKTVACAGRNGTVYLWETATLKEAGQLKAGGRLMQVVWLPTGKHVVVLLESGGVECLPISGRQAEWKLTAEGSVALAVSPDGKWLALSTSKGKIELYDLKTRNSVHTWHEDADFARSLAFSHDSQRLAAAFDKHMFHVWDVTTTKRLHQLTIGPWYQPSVLSLTFSADDKHLLAGFHHVASTPAARVVQWQLGDKEPTADRIVTDSDMLLDPRGQWFLAKHNGTLEVQVLANAKKPIPLAGVDGASMQRWTASPDGEVIAGINRSGRLLLWSSRSGKQLQRQPGHSHPLACLTLSHDGQRLVTADDCTSELQVWEAKASRVRALTARANSVLLTPDGKRVVVVTMDQELLALDLEKQQQGKLAYNRTYSGSGLSFLPDGQHVLYTECERELSRAECQVPMASWQRLYTWDLKASKGEQLPLEDADEVVHADTAVLSADGRWIVSWSADGSVVVWDARTGRRMLRQLYERQHIRQAQFSPDGRLLAVLAGDGVHILEVATGIERQVLKANSAIYSTVWLPNGRGLVCGHAEGYLTVRDVLNGRSAAKFDAHGGQVRVLSLSGDGKTLASGGDDGTVLLWKTPTPAFTPDRVGGLSAKQLDSAWNDLGSSNGLRVSKAILDLSEDPPRALPFLQRQLASVQALAMDDLNRLFADLDADRFATRQKATAQLTALGRSIEPALAELRRTTPSAEVRSRVGRVQEELDGKPLDAEVFRQARVIEILERSGTAEARALLESLTTQPAWTPLAREAQAALKRIAPR